jgi:hypothetical protein
MLAFRRIPERAERPAHPWRRLVPDCRLLTAMASRARLVRWSSFRSRDGRVKVKGFASASHVLLYPSDGQSGDEILSPGPPDGQRDLTNTIGYLQNAIVLVHYREQRDPERIINKTDIALAEIKNEFDFPYGNDVPIGNNQTARLEGVHDADALFDLINNESVCTVGRTTGFARGRVIAIGLQGFPIRLRDNKSYLYGDLIVVAPEDSTKGFSAFGDSGAPVYTQKGDLVGFVVGGPAVALSFSRR